MKDYCDRFINPYEFLAYYETAKKFVNETQDQLIYQLISRGVDIFTYSDLDMTNQIIPDVETLLSYRLTITPKELSDAKLAGGAVFSEHCQVTFDSVTFANNTADISGGAIYSKSSTVDIHNCKAEDDAAGGKGKFAMISSKSKFKTNYLTLIDIKRNAVVITNSSSTELRHVHLADGGYYCCITALRDSNIYLTIYSQGVITEEAHFDSYERNHVCRDKTSSIEGTPKGVFFIKYLGYMITSRLNFQSCLSVYS